MSKTTTNGAYTVTVPTGYVLINLNIEPDREHELIKPYHRIFNEVTNSWMGRNDFPMALRSSIDQLYIGVCIAVIEPATIAADRQLAASYEDKARLIKDFEDYPACPVCGNKFLSHWNGGSDTPIKISGTSLNRNFGDDGEHERITCPYCNTVYEVTLVVTRTAHFSCKTCTPSN